jgi:hypothetical protein
MKALVLGALLGLIAEAIDRRYRRAKAAWLSLWARLL